MFQHAANASGVKKESGPLNKTNKRLIAFGCSFTYGTGLPDCAGENSGPSEMGWPSILSDQLNLELVNVSASGASNFEILHNIINFDFKNDDTVVVMWTHYARDTFFRKLFAKKWSIDRIGPWSTSESAVDRLVNTNVRIGIKWIEHMNDKTFALKSWAHIHHADLYLKSKGVRYLHIPARPDELNQYPVTYKIDNLHLCGLPLVDVGHDNMHPGINSNKQTAELIHRLINEQI